MEKLRLLVIEDDKAVADLVCDAAADCGFATEWATGPSAIMESYDQFRPHVIVLDVLMPEMDGLEVLQFLRQELSQTKIIILSGSETSSRRITETMGTALGLQVVANIPKPFRLHHVKTTLTRILESLEAEQSAVSLQRAGRNNQ